LPANSPDLPSERAASLRLWASLNTPT